MLSSGIDFLSQDPDKLKCASLPTYVVSNKIEDPKAENELVGPTGEDCQSCERMVVKNSLAYYRIPMGLDGDNDA